MPIPQKQPIPLLKNSFLEVLLLIKHKANDKGLRPVISMAKVIDMMGGAGMHVTPQQLLDLSQDSSVRGLIKSINKNELTVNTDYDDSGDSELEPELPSSNAEQPLVPPTPAPNSAATEPMDGQDLQAPEEPFPTDQPYPPPTQARQPNVVSQMARRAMSRN